MNAYKFANVPSNSSVDFGVTMLVSMWFLVAAGAILSDPSSTYTSRDQAQALSAQAETAPAPALAVAPAIAPEARVTILVEARRSTNL